MMLYSYEENLFFQEPILWIQQIAGVIATDFDSLGDRTSALVHVFLENVKENAVVHMVYVQDLVLIFYR